MARGIYHEIRKCFSYQYTTVIFNGYGPGAKVIASNIWHELEGMTSKPRGVQSYVWFQFKDGKQMAERNRVLRIR